MLLLLCDPTMVWSLIRVTRTYSELKELKTFNERFEYLKIGGKIGAATFGGHRYLNQRFYQSDRWKDVRVQVIIRDQACDMGIEGLELKTRLYVHHMNPIDISDIVHGESWIYDPEYLICVSESTHKAIHYGDISLLDQGPIVRKPGDTLLW